MRYGRQSAAICADSGYGSEMNYEYLVDNNFLPYVKYNMFHKEMTRSMKNDAYLPSNMYYNADEDYYICPMGQRLEYVGQTQETSYLGYVSTKSVYQATNCKGCPLRVECYKGKYNRRSIEVNHRNNELRAVARKLLNSDEDLRHRSRRPIEPEAVFGQIKYNNHFRRFSYRGKTMVKAEFATIATAHNIRKYIRTIAIQNANKQPA